MFFNLAPATTLIIKIALLVSYLRIWLSPELGNTECRHVAHHVVGERGKQGATAGGRADAEPSNTARKVTDPTAFFATGVQELAAFVPQAGVIRRHATEKAVRPETSSRALVPRKAAG